jgi:hypothetical protein
LPLLSRDRLRSWDEIRAETPVDERDVEAIERLMDAEEQLYKFWESQNTGMNWAGEELSRPIEEQDVLWVAALGERVAALGGHLELLAVFPKETITLVREPGLLSPSDNAD